MTALRTLVGVCNGYVKALKKKLTGKRRRVFRSTAIGPDHDGGGGCSDNYCYDNEAVDNVINEFLEKGKKTWAADRD